MAGIYFHIPFCKTRCNYCDFYKTTLLGLKKDLLDGLHQELITRQDYLGQERISSIYLGGGTPSLLDPGEINHLLAMVYRLFKVDDQVEITLEANPDDLSLDYLISLRDIKVNRLSIGIQSFIDEHLLLMNRRHSSKIAHQAITLAEKAGFDNLSMDLIYGIPGMSMKQWKENLEITSDLPVQHVSAYHLTLEKDTVFHEWKRAGKLHEVDEEESWQQFDMLAEKLENAGFEHYEISNFAKPGCYSKHNTNYWRQEKYMGIGPSAHSYDLSSRQWNVPEIEKYTGGLKNKEDIFFEKEELDSFTRFNEYIMTGLRTTWGIDMNHVKNEFGEKLHEFLLEQLRQCPNDVFVNEQGKIRLNKKGMFLSDSVISQLMYV